MTSESDSSFSDLNTSEVLDQYESTMKSLREKSHSNNSISKLDDEYENMTMELVKQQLKETETTVDNSTKRHKSMIKKKKSSKKSKKKVGFHDDIHLIIDEQSSFRTRSISLSKLSSQDSDENISLKHLLEAHKKYYVIDKLVFRFANNINWNG